MNRGVVFALSAYIFWGLHPIYWKWLNHVPSIEILAHRIFWSFIFFLVIITCRKDWSSLFGKIRSHKRPWMLILPAFLIGSNWGVYIWAVNANFIIETSLGYFICPLVSVLLGMVFLHERLGRLQWLAVVIAGFGVLTMTVKYGQFPWISLYLAGTWGAYGLLRKQSPLSPVEGLTLETVLLSVPAFIYHTVLTVRGSSSFFMDFQTSALLIGTGLISGLPLLVFIAGSRLIRLSLVGILQYVYPTLVFLIGFYVYHEPMDDAKIYGFIFIWTAIVIYLVSETLQQFRKPNG